MNDPIEILICEDNQDDLDMALYALRKAHLANRIQVVRDGAEALDFIFGQGHFAERKINTPAPKLVLLDLKLPKVDGFEVVRRLKSDPETKHIPVVILTSSKEQRDLFETYQLGVNSYIEKPVDFQGFVAAVENLGLYWLLLNQLPKVGG